MSYIERIRGAQEPSNVVRLPAGVHRAPSDGVHPYAAAIRQAWLDRLTKLAAKSWQHGDAWDTNCFVSARKLLELANSPWAGYSVAEAHEDYMSHAPHDRAWDARKKCWEQAVKVTGAAGLPEPAPGEKWTVPDVSVLDGHAPSLTDEAEAAFWSERGILEHLRTFAQARRVSPWAVLGVSLARICALTPHQVCLPPIVGGRGSLNIFVGLVGNSGDGKGAASSAAADALGTKHVNVARIASGEAITHVYKFRDKAGADWRDDEHSALIDISEIDRLTAQAGRQGATIMADLRSAWSGEQLGQIAADRSRSLPLEAHEYRLALVAGIQPHRAAAILDDADGGTPQRFLWLPALDPDAPNDEIAEPEPWLWRAPSTGSLIGIGGLRMRVCPEAVETIKEARLARLRGDGDALDGHALFARLKVAAILGIAEGRYSVDGADWRLAGVVMDKSDQTRAGVVAARKARAKEEVEKAGYARAQRDMKVDEVKAEAAIKRVCTGVLRNLRRGEECGMTIGALRKKATSADRSLVPEALERLIEAGRVTPDPANPERFRVAPEVLK